jgi:hypothetical protein
VTLQPERTTFAPSSGQPVQTPAPQRQRYWRVSNFRLRVDPLDCRRVTKVEAGVITRSSNGLDFPDLTITLSEAGSDQWDAWHQEFVERGQNDAGHEKAGTLTFLAPDMNTELGSVKLGGLGLYRLAPETTTTQSGDMIRRLVAELYCQRMELSVAAHSWP